MVMFLLLPQLRQQRHFLPLLLLTCAPSLFTLTSAFAVTYYDELRFCRPLTLQLQSTPLVNVNVDGDASSSQYTCAHHKKSIDSFRLEGIIQWCKVSLVIAFAAIAILPTLSLASVDVDKVSAPLDRVGVWSSSAVIATENLSSISPSSISELGLKPATEEKPQIMLPDGLPSKQKMPRQANERKPILQGLVYFPERAPKDPAIKSSSGPQVKQQLDYYSDILVLTAVSATQPEGPVLAGAKFPVSSVRFPFLFQMYEENLLTSRPGVLDAWGSLAETGDVILRANICPSDSSTLPCADSETKKYAEGLAKIITHLPGLKEGEVIRAPASLALQ